MRPASVTIGPAACHARFGRPTLVVAAGVCVLLLLLLLFLVAPSPLNVATQLGTYSGDSSDEEAATYVPPALRVRDRSKLARVTWVCVSRRGHYFQRVVNMFRSQDWPNKELIFVTNLPSHANESSGEGYFETSYESVGENIHHYKVHSRPPKKIGFGLNLAVDKATGEVFMKIDDDDFYSPHYTSELMQYSPKALLVGRTYSYIYLRKHNITLRGCLWQTPALDSPSSVHVFGSTLTCPMSVVRKHRFDETVILGEDSEWLDRLRQADILPVRLSWGGYYLIRHDMGHTWSWPAIGFMGELLFEGMDVNILAGNASRRMPPPWVFHFTSTREMNGITVVAHVTTCKAANVKFLMRNYGRTSFFLKDAWVIVEPRLPHGPDCDHTALYDEVNAFMLYHDPRHAVDPRHLDRAAYSNFDLCDVYRRLQERHVPIFQPFITLATHHDHWGREYFMWFDKALKSRRFFLGMVGSNEHPRGMLPDALRVARPANASRLSGNKTASTSADASAQASFERVINGGAPLYPPAYNRTWIVASSFIGEWCASTHDERAFPRRTYIVRQIDWRPNGQLTEQYVSHETELYQTSDMSVGLDGELFASILPTFFMCALVALLFEAYCVLRFWFFLFRRLLAVSS